MRAWLDSLGGNDRDAAVGRGPRVGPKRFAPVEKPCFLLSGDFVWRPVELHFAEINVAVLSFNYKVDLRALFRLGFGAGAPGIYFAPYAGNAQRLLDLVDVE